MFKFSRMTLAIPFAALLALPCAFAQSGPTTADPKVNAQPSANMSAAASGSMETAPSEAADGGKPAMEVDTNFDGQVSRDEAAAEGMNDSDFDAGDADANGLMSKAEYDNALEQMKK